MAEIDPKLIARFDPQAKFLNDPKYNPKLAALQKAYQSAGSYTGSVPGGRASPFLAQTLNSALSQDGIKDPITGELKVIPGFIGTLADNIFNALKSDKQSFEVTLRAIALKREAIKKENIKQEEDRAYLRRLFDRESYESADAAKNYDPKQKLKEALERIGLNPPEKGAADKTSIPKLSAIITKETLVFDADKDAFSDIKDITSNADLSTRLSSYLSIAKGFKDDATQEVSVISLLQKDPPNVLPSHVALRFSGALERYIDTSDPDINIEKERLAGARGTLSLNGQEISKDDVVYLTWQEFQDLKYKAGADKSLDSLSIVSFNDLDGDGTLSAQDERGAFQSVILEGSTKISNGLEGTKAITTAELSFPSAHKTNSFQIEVDGTSLGNNFLEDLQSGALEVYIYEAGVPTYKQQKAVLDVANSKDNLLAFNFDREISDGVNLKFYRRDSAIELQRITLIP